MCGSSFYHLHALKASRNLHDRIFRQVLKGAMSFFDTTPMGQILSKFSADLDIVDTLLPQTSEQCFNLLSMCVTSTILICIVMSLIIGSGLMALAFFSAKHGYDENVDHDLESLIDKYKKL